MVAAVFPLVSNWETSFGPGVGAAGPVSVKVWAWATSIREAITIKIDAAVCRVFFTKKQGRMR